MIAVRSVDGYSLRPRAGNWFGNGLENTVTYSLTFSRSLKISTHGALMVIHRHAQSDDLVLPMHVFPS